MSTILRTWSYKYQWLYNSVSALATLSVGGEDKFRSLTLADLDLNRDAAILDLCCGAGQTTQLLVRYSDQVTGLDVSPVALARAKQKVPQAIYVEGLAQKMPIADNSFDLVHSSAAMHEMTGEELKQIFREVYRVLKPNGIFTFSDFHQPTNPLFLPPVALFLFLFETETAWALLKTDLPQELAAAGFTIRQQKFYAGGSLQVIQAQKI
jgi:demethylmenaquinone methyltransferase/2-methoxy-6-polyprenyl-1,4-benzoquinol methylase